MTKPRKSFAPVQTWLPPWGLSDCICAVLVRNTQGVNLNESDRWSYYPTMPMCSISHLWAGTAEVVARGAEPASEMPRQVVASLSVSGPQATPRQVFYPDPAHGVMVLFYPDAWHALTGTSLATLTDRIVDADTVLPQDVQRSCEVMAEKGSDDERVRRFFDALMPVWQQRTKSVHHPRWMRGQWSEGLQPWMASLALRASATGWGRSLRQSERRIKRWTGWSLRRLQGSVRGEAVFFAAMAAVIDDRVDWAEIALDHGFSDQSHLIREVRRLTGFTPEALRRGILNDEAFWSYRAWAALAGHAR